MQKKNKNSGFTMAELLIVVGIIAVLAAVSFVGIIGYMRSLAKLEYDNYAKEIFVAAQNHLTMAKSQGYLGAGDSAGTKEKEEYPTGIQYVNSEGEPVIIPGDGVYFYEVVSGKPVGNVASNSIINLMLPFGAIDDTIRSGGSYIIRYHKDAGEILDVFYWREDGRYPYYDKDETGNYPNYDALLVASKSANQNDLLKNFNGENAVIGWFGGEDASRLSVESDLNKPKIKVKNAETLTATITDKNPLASDLKLLITGVTSGACKAITIRSDNSEINSDYFTTVSSSDKGTVYEIVLDDITADDGHFYYRYCTAGCPGKDLGEDNDHYFIPGENITIQAVASYPKKLSKVVYSSKVTTNSLFGSIRVDGVKKTTASITNIRHLENLDLFVSNLNYGNNTQYDNPKQKKDQFNFVAAVQRADLSWKEFKNETGGENVLVYRYNGEGDGLTEAGCFYPVTLGSILKYDGMNHSIFDVDVKFQDVIDPNDDTGKRDVTGAGLFGSLTGKRTISNLKLVDFNVEGSGDAGALAGSTVIGEGEEPTNDKKCVITNVIAFNTKTNAITATVKGGANTGGLVGSAENSEITKSAASLVVFGSGNAGGLVGNANNTKIEGCYSGGHTINGDYKQVKDGDNIVYNVTGTTNAGGLVGTADATTSINYSYSTCSATGNTVGGLVGSAAGTITGCYATGLVQTTVTTDDTFPEGAFVGTLSSTATLETDNGTPISYYFQIINEREGTNGYEYLPPIGTIRRGTVITIADANTNAKVSAMDATADAYNTFVGAPSGWDVAIPYDAQLAVYYRDNASKEGRFNLWTVSDLGVIIEDDEFVTAHYGDWPAPEIFVINN